MGNVYSLDTERNLILYRAGTSLYIRSTAGENMTRPVTLCTDYKDSLTDTAYNGTVYYAYRSTEQNLIVRSITDLQHIYRISSREIPDCYDPRLVTFREELVLFYTTKSPLNNAYYLKAVFPLKPEIRIKLPETAFSESLNLGILVMADLLILSASSQEKQILFSLNSAFEPVVYPSDSPALEKRLETTSAQLHETQQKLEDASFQLAETQQKLEDTSSQLVETQQKLSTASKALHDTQQKLGLMSKTLRDTQQKSDTASSQLSEMQQKFDKASTQLADTQQKLSTISGELAQTKSDLTAAQLLSEELKAQNIQLETGLRTQAQSHDETIASIRTQYNELMETATRYREEAVRWHDIACKKEAKPIPGESLIADTW